MRILVVDDEKAVLAALKRYLVFHHKVVVVESASEALLALSRGSFDLILCDVHMPGMDGVTFASRLSPLDAAKVVFITGGAGTPDEVALLGGRPMLLKPFAVEELFRVIETVAGH